jgi:hypothetical protein
MADEAVCIETPTEFARFTVADGTGIAVGTLLKLSGDNTAIASSGADVFAGIAWEEKTASDGITEIVAAKNGIWDIKCAGSTVALGSIVSLSGTNLIKLAVEAECVTGACLGKALEAGSAAEVIRVNVGRLV